VKNRKKIVTIVTFEVKAMDCNQLRQRKERHKIVTGSSPSSPSSDALFRSDDPSDDLFLKIVTG